MSKSELCACIIARQSRFVNSFFAKKAKEFPKTAKKFKKALYKTEKSCYNEPVTIENGILLDFFHRLRDGRGSAEIKHAKCGVLREWIEWIEHNGFTV